PAGQAPGRAHRRGLSGAVLVSPTSQPPHRVAAPAGRRLMRSGFLPFSPPLIGEEDIAEVVRTLRSGWITTGERTHEFEEKFRDFVGAPDALAVNSATSAMHLALAALGIGDGDAVVTTTMTFASTVHVIEHQRARPVLVDVEPDHRRRRHADGSLRAGRAGARVEPSRHEP